VGHDGQGLGDRARQVPLVVGVDIAEDSAIATYVEVWSPTARFLPIADNQVVL
jgi:hypothetical protein